MTSNLESKLRAWAKTQWERIPPVPHAHAGSYDRGYQNGLADVLRGVQKVLESSGVETSEPLVDWKASYVEALRQRDALQTDANRYRWLREYTYVEAYYIDGCGGADTKVRAEGGGDALDLAVDMERIKERPRSAVEPSAGNHAPACAAHDGKRCNCGIGSSENGTSKQT